MILYTFDECHTFTVNSKSMLFKWNALIENLQIHNLLLKSFIIRLTDETIHSRIQSGMKKEKKLFEILLSDNERKFHELESKHRYLMEDKDTLQSR